MVHRISVGFAAVAVISSEPTRRRQPQHRSQSTPDGFIEINLAAVEMGEIANDRQSQTGTGNLIIQPFADLEYAIARFRRQSRPIIFDFDDNLRLALIHEAADRNHAGGPLAGIVDQVGEHLIEIHRVA